MNNPKKAKAVYLFREMGGIDDALLQEAIIYRPHRVLPRFLMIAACLALTFMLSLGVLIVSMRQDNDGTTKEENDGTSADVTVNDFTLYSQSTAHTVLTSAEELDFFDGNAYVVWQNVESKELCVSRALSNAELNKLKKEINNGTNVGTSSAEPTYRVWILLGDGNVLTPHLKLSDGNVGSAELFEYNPELIPSNGFNSQISEILN